MTTLYTLPIDEVLINTMMLLRRTKGIEFTRNDAAELVRHFYVNSIFDISSNSGELPKHAIVVADFLQKEARLRKETLTFSTPKGVKGATYNGRSSFIIEVQ